MTVRKILLYPADQVRLRKKSTEVKRIDPEMKTLIADLKETLLANPGAGLAAPQIGVHKRITVVRFGQDEGEMGPPIALINPVIVERGPLETGFDGCLSMPGLMTWDTARPAWMVVNARDEAWKKIQLRVEGIDARLVDHEVDHLDGRLYFDLMKPGHKLFTAVTGKDGKEKLVEVTP